jgi:hypothetical protein
MHLIWYKDAYFNYSPPEIQAGRQLFPIPL